RCARPPRRGRRPDPRCRLALSAERGMPNQEGKMSTTARDENALTARNRSVDVDGAMLVYRRFGNADSAAPPLLCPQHFCGNLDNWNPAFVDCIARERQVMLLNGG